MWVSGRMAAGLGPPSCGGCCGGQEDRAARRLASGARWSAIDLEMALGGTAWTSTAIATLPRVQLATTVIWPPCSEPGSLEHGLPSWYTGRLLSRFPAGMKTAWRLKALLAYR